MDVLEGLRFGSPITDEHRSRAVADAFRKLDDRGSGVIVEEDLRRRYDSALATAACTGCVRVYRSTPLVFRFCRRVISPALLIPQVYGSHALAYRIAGSNLQSVAAGCY